MITGVNVPPPLGGRLATPWSTTRTATLLWLKSWSNADFMLLVVEGDQVIEDGPAVFASEWSGDEETCSKAVSFGHQMASSLKCSSVMACRSAGFGKRFVGLIVLALTKFFCHQSPLLGLEVLDLCLRFWAVIQSKGFHLGLQPFEIVTFLKIMSFLRGKELQQFRVSEQLYSPQAIGNKCAELLVEIAPLKVGTGVI